MDLPSQPVPRGRGQLLSSRPRASLDAGTPMLYARQMLLGHSYQNTSSRAPMLRAASLSPGIPSSYLSRSYFPTVEESESLSISRRANVPALLGSPGSTYGSGPAASGDETSAPTLNEFAEASFNENFTFGWPPDPPCDYNDRPIFNLNPFQVPEEPPVALVCRPYAASQEDNPRDLPSRTQSMFAHRPLNSLAPPSRRGSATCTGCLRSRTRSFQPFPTTSRNPSSAELELCTDLRSRSAPVGIDAAPSEHRRFAQLQLILGTSDYEGTAFYVKPTARKPATHATA
ncbi:hypothetical protein C8Q79DRAFT_524617 [Trametes meyenii]|nr:hypothetical protein C8Q79DRAFT_524617 [Trametes meyenii]